MADTLGSNPGWIDTITRDSATLAAVGEDNGDALIEHCPGWSMIDLLTHMGHVQRWATGILATGELTESPPAEEFSSATAAAEFLRDATGKLLDTLANVDPADPAWNFTSAPQTKEFWFRRQANEVAVHRWDAENAANVATAPLRPEVAADVIDEFVTRVIDRIIDREDVDLSDMFGDVHLHCTDVTGEWTFEAVDGIVVVSAEHRKSAAAVRGPATDLALFLYGRGSDDNLEMFGDQNLLDRWTTLLTF